jgi:large subunit ribosomal protein L18
MGINYYSGNFDKRKQRTRRKLKLRAEGKPRLSVFRSAQHIYAQIIDDVKGVTLASISTLDKELKVKLSGKAAKIEGALVIGEEVAKRAMKAGVKQVVFDRGGYLYHGRVKALAEAARKAGLEF